MNRRLAIAFAALTLQACAIPQALPEATDLQAGAGEVVVIGKVELVPPLDAREQRSHWNAIGEKRFLERVWLATGAEHRPIDTTKLDASQFGRSLEAKWGVPFMVKVPRQRTYLNGGVLHLDVMQQERIWFPGGFYFEVPEGAPAVYVGTLRYHRNDFNVITRVEVVNERADVAAVLKGSPASDVRVSLLRRVPERPILRSSN
ncbi:hypothetical protein EZ313_01685 [Ramlibacter henchirensis]|uniref:Uncharacterized protein n=1 Tax=Ramlibacter henchirensis TaxID=204072 RepID=A0A4Z0C4M0_9BURK|nr:hypothetical protein [Ramlibacter henchirensis]TFZ05410.1 hypothetical protein EZ313_01685 [Ramlibacter henchirensis]